MIVQSVTRGAVGAAPGYLVKRGVLFIVSSPSPGREE